MVLLVLVLLLVMAILFGILSWVVHHLFLLGVVGAVVVLVLVGRAHNVTFSSLRHDLQQDIHASNSVRPRTGATSEAVAVVVRD